MGKILLRIIIAFIVLDNSSALAQTRDTSRQANLKDSIKTDFVARMQAFAKKSSKESAADFAADKAAIAQGAVLDNVKKTMQKASILLKGGIDTAGSATKLNSIEKDLIIASDGVLVNKGTSQTFRNLTATSKILTELLNQTRAIKIKLEQYRKGLSTYRYQLDSLISVPDLFLFPKDSVHIIKYLAQLKVIGQQMQPIDSSLNKANDRVQLLLNRVNLIEIKLEGAAQEVDQDQRLMARRTFHREFEDIWGPVGYFRPMSEILKQAKAKGELTLIFYVEDNVGKIVLLLLLITCSYLYLCSLKRIYIEKGLLEKGFEGQLVLKRPLLSALIIVIHLFQFIFVSPPFVLNVIFWTITSVSLSVLFYKYITRYWMMVWLTMLTLFLLSSGDNLILQASRAERWFTFILSLAGAIIGAVVCIAGKKEELRERWIVIAIGFMSFLEACAVIANIFGRYNLAKTLFIGGYMNVVIAILFLWTVRMINEGLFLAFNVYVQQDKKLFYLNFDRVGKKVPGYFYILLVAGWVILLGRNFIWFPQIVGPLQDFFEQERTLGDYTFSINKLLLFFAIMVASVIVSKVVSFFAADNHLEGVKDDKNNKQGVGSWLLLIRITILSLGLFLAIAAAGIPVDRIAIIIGALGVGIGFGLQTIVNNLVSGLIIAFEKPVNVGDIVEVGGQTGTMKSIGFRSSVISNYDGADIVIPNGDLLNAHLINWTLGGGRKRVSILIGIAYDADLQKAKLLLNDILNGDDRIAKHTPPVVQYDQFSSSSIDVRIYFWARKMKDAGEIKSDLIVAISSAFAAHGIIIPYPQQEVYLHPSKSIENENGETHDKKSLN